MKNNTPTAEDLAYAERLFKFMVREHKALKLKRKFSRMEWKYTVAQFAQQTYMANHFTQRKGVAQ